MISTAQFSCGNAVRVVTISAQADRDGAPSSAHLPSFLAELAPRVGGTAVAVLIVVLFGRNAAMAEPRDTIAQLDGVAGCVAAQRQEGCGRGLGLDGASATAVSPDGRHVYVASNDASSVAIFGRWPNGILRQQPGADGCVAEAGAGGCATVRGLRGAFSIVVSADGRHVYVGAFQTVAVLQRDPITGRLTQLARACAGEEPGCEPARGLDGVTSVVLSPDGRFLYATASRSGSVAGFARDPATGALTQLPGMDGCVRRREAGDACAVDPRLRGAFSVALSPDGLNAYVSALEEDAVVTLARDTDTGALGVVPTASGCVRQGGGADCERAHGLRGPNSVVVSADGRHVYAAASASSAIAIFMRDGRDGGRLLQQPGADGCISQDGTDGCATGRGLTGAYDVVLSPEGDRAFTASSDAVVAFARDVTTGTLADLPSRGGCLSVRPELRCMRGRGLTGAARMGLAPDGRSLYVAAFASDALATILTEGRTGGPEVRITQQRGRCSGAGRAAVVSVLVRGSLPVREVETSVDGRALTRGSRTMVRVPRSRRLVPGRRLRVVATDIGGRRTVRRATVLPCSRRRRP